MDVVILLSSPRPEGVAVILVLPAGSRILLQYSEEEQVDISPIAADALLRYLLSSTAEREAIDGVTLGTVVLEGGSPEQVRFATADLYSGTVGEIPPDRLIPLLTQALSALLAAAQLEEAATPAGETPETRP